ncbi:MAG: type II toxin-antitoxin system VapC family toxin [Candidatus Dormibacteraceae bacterium]
MIVLDASALLAFLQDEPGADKVAGAIAARACICSVNLAEVLSKRSDLGEDPDLLLAEMKSDGLLGKAGALEVIDLTLEDSVAIAKLRKESRSLGLSLGDRACLALSQRLNVAVFTADRAWLKLSIGISIEAIR